MASRYWVGGTATWDATAGTKWATTSGGAGGASAPTASDDVFLDAASGAVTITTASGATCRDLTCTGFTGTLALGNTTTINIAGSLLLVVGMTVSIAGGSAALFFNATTSGKTVTTAGKTMPGMTFSGAGGAWTLQDALAATGGTATVTLTQGTLNTNGQSVTAGSFASSNSNTRTLTLGASSMTLSSSSSAAWENLTDTNLTVTANTATVTFTANGAGFRAASKNYNGLSVVATQPGDFTFVGTLTFANVTRAGTASKTDTLILGGNITCTGTFTVNGNSATNRVLVRSSAAGTARTITAATVSASNVDFQDITGAGAASWNLSAITGLSGDAGGNSGITFTTAQTNYYRTSASGATTDWDTASNWSLTSGGGATGRVPLPQDTARFDANSRSVQVTSGRFGSVDMTGYTSTFTVGTTTWYGSWTIGSGATLAGTATQTLAGRGSHTITTNGKTITFSVTVNAVTGTYTLQDAFTTNRNTASGVLISSGTLDLNGQSFTMTGANGTLAMTSGISTLDAAGSTLTFSGSGGAFGATSGTPTVIGGTWLIGGSSALPWNWNATGTVSGAPNVSLTGASASSRTFAGGGKTYGTLTYTVAASTGQLSITGSNTFDTINVSGGARTLAFTAGTTTTVNTAFNVFGTGGNLVTIGSITAANHTLAKAGGGVIDDVDYVSISRSTATPGSTWYAGANSTDGGNNSGWTFTDAPSGAINVDIGQATGTSSANAITPTKARAIAQATETDTAGAVGRAKTTAIGRATEADTGSAFGVLRSRSIGQASELDTAGSMTGTKRTSIGQAADTSTGGSIAEAESRSVGQATETDTASTVTSSRSFPIPQAGETDAGGSLTPIRTVSLGQAVEGDTGGQVRPTKATAIGQAAEADAAAVIAALRSIAVGQASETDTALALVALLSLVAGRGEAGVEARQPAHAGVESRKPATSGVEPRGAATVGARRV